MRGSTHTGTARVRARARRTMQSATPGRCSFVGELPTPGSACGVSIDVREGGTHRCPEHGCLGTLSARNTLRVARHGPPPVLYLLAQGRMRAGWRCEEGWGVAEGFEPVLNSWSVKVGRLLASIFEAPVRDADVYRQFEELHVHIEDRDGAQRWHFHLQTRSPFRERREAPRSVFHSFLCDTGDAEGSGDGAEGSGDGSGKERANAYVFGPASLRPLRKEVRDGWSAFRAPRTARDLDVLRSPIVARAVQQVLEASPAPAARWLFAQDDVM